MRTGLDASTVTPGITPPDGSFTVPVNRCLRECRCRKNHQPGERAQSALQPTHRDSFRQRPERNESLSYMKMRHGHRKFASPVHCFRPGFLPAASAECDEHLIRDGPSVKRRDHVPGFETIEVDAD